MKTLILVTISAFALSAIPAGATLVNEKPDNSANVVPQAVSMNAAPDAAECGPAKDMIIIVRDDDGSIVAIGKARVAPAC